MSKHWLVWMPVALLISLPGIALAREGSSRENYQIIPDKIPFQGDRTSLENPADPPARPQMRPLGEPPVVDGQPIKPGPVATTTELPPKPQMRPLGEPPVVDGQPMKPGAVGITAEPPRKPNMKE